jgi:hypothetical protein
MKTYTFKEGNKVLVLNTRYGSTTIYSTAYQRGVDTLLSMTNNLKNSLFWQLHNDWLIYNIIYDSHKRVSGIFKTTIENKYEEVAKFSFFNPLSEYDKDRTIWYDKTSKNNHRDCFTTKYAFYHEYRLNEEINYKTHFIYLDENNSVLKGSLNGKVNIMELSTNELKQLLETQHDDNQIQLFKQKLEKDYDYVIDVTNQRNVYASRCKNDYKHHKYVTHGKYGLVYLCMWNDSVVVNEPVEQVISAEERFRKSIKELYANGKLPENRWVTVNLNEKTFRICNVNTYLEKNLTSTQGIYITGNHINIPVLLFREEWEKYNKELTLYLTSDIIRFINKSGKPLHIDL